MALANKDLYSQSTRAPLKKIQPAEGPGSAQVRVLAAGSGTLPVGTPLYVAAATGLMAKCVPGAVLNETNDIFAIVWPDDITLDAANEVQGTVMLKGAIAFDELEALRAAGTLAGTAQQLKDMARKPTNRYRGIVIEGLDKLGGNAALA